MPGKRHRRNPRLFAPCADDATPFLKGPSFRLAVNRYAPAGFTGRRGDGEVRGDFVLDNVDVRSIPKKNSGLPASPPPCESSPSARVVTRRCSAFPRRPGLNPLDNLVLGIRLG